MHSFFTLKITMKRVLKLFTLLIGVFASAHAADLPYTVFADFEGGTHAPWTVEGNAFGSAPTRNPPPTQQIVNFRGQALANSLSEKGDSATGRLTSPSFVIQQPYLAFLLGGGNHPLGKKQTANMHLVVDGKAVRSATGSNSDRMDWVNWNVSEFKGKTGQLVIEDTHTGGWGHIVVDHIVFASVTMPTFTVAAPFGDHMVLQRDKPVVVWGRGLPGDSIRVTFAGQTKTTQADASNKWRLQLDPLPASTEGRELVVEQAGGERAVFTDVLVGEVWLAGGQSNMGFNVNGVLQAQRELASANFPKIRLMQVPYRGSAEPLDDAVCRWESATPKTVAGFSGVAYFFARSLHERLGVPVGIMRSSVGGTAAEQWTPAETLARDPEWNKAMVAELAEAQKNIELGHTFPALLKAWREANGCTENEAIDSSWADPALDTSDWKSAPVPIVYSKVLGAPAGGTFWMRKDFEVPSDKAGKAVSIIIGNLDRHFLQVFLNGENIGTLGDEPPSFYQTQSTRITLPGKGLKAGRNVLALRCTTFAPNSTFRQAVAGMGLPVADPATLDSAWLLKAETRYPAVTPAALAALPIISRTSLMSVSTGLYNAMIHPLVPFSLRGMIWYQGESNAFRADRYKDLLTAMITEWRSRFGQGDFPFYQVQLANYYDPATEPAPTDRRTTDDWVARVREAQLQVTQSVPRIGMAVAIDVGEKDIHPKNKQDVGDRLARLALAKTYGQPQVEYVSPVYASMQRAGAAIKVRFTTGTGGLMVAAKAGLEPALETPGTKLAQFAIAGADRKFVWAEATIDGENTVIVSSPSVPEPVAVRYAWSLNPEGRNLYGRNGLPASPFRSDDWPLPPK